MRPKDHRRKQDILLSLRSPSASGRSSAAPDRSRYLEPPQRTSSAVRRDEGSVIIFGGDDDYHDPHQIL